MDALSTAMVDWLFELRTLGAPRGSSGIGLEHERSGVLRTVKATGRWSSAISPGRAALGAQNPHRARMPWSPTMTRTRST